MLQNIKEKYEESQLYRIRHSVAHVMAQAVLEMFPDGKITIGPPVENGFYYDFDLPRNLTPEGLERGGRDEYGNPLNEIPEISIYQHDTFVDLCRGPHVQNTREINPHAFK